MRRIQQYKVVKTGMTLTRGIIQVKQRLKKQNQTKKPASLFMVQRAHEVHPAIGTSEVPTKQNDSAMGHDDSLRSVKQPCPVTYAQVETGAK